MWSVAFLRELSLPFARAGIHALLTSIFRKMLRPPSRPYEAGSGGEANFAPA